MKQKPRYMFFLFLLILKNKAIFFFNFKIQYSIFLNPPWKNLLNVPPKKNHLKSFKIWYLIVPLLKKILIFQKPSNCAPSHEKNEFAL